LTPQGVSGCIANLSGNIIKIKQEEFKGNTLSIEFLIDSIKHLYKSLAEEKKYILAAGISLPGIVKERVLSRIPDLSALNDTDIYTLIEKSLCVPVIINNVPGVAAVGELICSYPESSSLVYLNIMQNIGIGAGIIVGGKLIKGKDGIAGEVGDFFFDRKSFSGEASRSVGRLEEYAGLSSLYERADQLIKNGGALNLKNFLEQTEHKKLTLSLIEQSIDAGDEDLKSVYIEVIKVWAILIIDFVLMLNPEIIVIGGAVREENKMTQQVINEMLEKELFVKQTIELSKKGTVFAGGMHMLKSYVFSNIIARKATEEN
jgi:glucokinase